MFRGGDYVDDPKFYNPQQIKNTLNVSVSAIQIDMSLMKFVGYCWQLRSCC